MDLTDERSQTKQIAQDTQTHLIATYSHCNPAFTDLPLGVFTDMSDADAFMKELGFTQRYTEFGHTTIYEKPSGYQHDLIYLVEVDNDIELAQRAIYMREIL